MGELIPMTRPPRSAGLSTQAMTLFLVSWSVTFITLFIAAIWVRARAAIWPPSGAPVLPVAAPIIGSLFVLASSVTAQALLKAFRAGRADRARLLLFVTLLLGAGFFVMQCVQWAQLWGAGLRLPMRREGMGWDPSVAYAGCFYALTWLHAAHVVAAIGVLGWHAPRLRRGDYTVREHQPLRFAVWFWHFVTVAWFGVWPAAYLS